MMHIETVNGMPYIPVQYVSAQWRTPRSEQGQMVRHSFAGRTPAGDGQGADLAYWLHTPAGEPGPGDAAMRITDETGTHAYYLRPEVWTVEMSRWKLRGGVHVEETRTRQATLDEVVRGRLGRDQDGWTLTLQSPIR